MVLYKENPKDVTRKLLELINKFSKVAGYKISTQKSLVFLHTNNKRSEREIRKQSHLRLQQKTLKYPGINLSKEVKDIYLEKYKTLMKESEDRRE